MKKRKNISSLMVLKVSCVLSLLTFPMLFLWGKSLSKELHYDEIMENFCYYPEEILDNFDNYIYELNANMSLEPLYELDNKVQTLDDLIELSDEVAIVTMKDYEVSGTGLLGTFEIEEVIKSDSLSKGDTIKIYDLVTSIWTEEFARERNLTKVSVHYVEGNTPLIQNERYIVFFKKAIKPVEENTYMYTSLQYGNFRITDFPNILENASSFIISDKDKSLKDASAYDTVFNKEQEEKEAQLFHEVYNRYKKFVKQ